MIQKFKSIGNLAVFQNFQWDQCVKDSTGAIKSFREINILYGRNYSGKTTLSRIVRAMETGVLSDKYDHPQFQVQLADSQLITATNLTTHGHSIRVFNEDFVRDNLRFISDPDESIKSFAILGDNNNKIEEEIKRLESELGINEIGKESGLYLVKASKDKDYQKAKANAVNAMNQLQNQLKAKAIDPKNGIKYQAPRFGDQNYTVAKLDAELQEVSKASFQQSASEQIQHFETLIDEKVLSPVPTILVPTLALEQLVRDSQSLLAKSISESNKIEELLKDAILNKWVQEGLAHHQNKRITCAFCGNEIQENRWKELEHHFDEESRKLDAAIELLLKQVDLEKREIDSKFLISKSQFYSKFHEQVESIASSITSAISIYKSSLENIAKLLQDKKDDKFRRGLAANVTDNSSVILQSWKKYIDLAKESDAYTAQLSKDQDAAKKQLRLDEVFRFSQTIDYTGKTTEIATLKSAEQNEFSSSSEVTALIQQKQMEIAAKRRELNDEEKGALKVNEYLNHHFGHQFLSLRAIKDASNPNDPSIRFEVHRGKKKAYHLSEGECSLLAFCYFLAKLDDIDTKGLKPIIWIDDPISSLDSNHVFFVYSLINIEIVERHLHKQLFISTHNLVFLKYLKRLPGADKDWQKSDEKKRYQHLIITRESKHSSIRVMPRHLKDYITEFNHLFHHIYKCAQSSATGDDEFNVFYDFGNSARKFLEIYLHYKLPDFRKDDEKFTHFFGVGKIPVIFTDRINNEYSHLCGSFERGAVPVIVPEMKTAAQHILKRIKELDPDQYQALLNSVGETEMEVTI